jgi:uncharacterized membrane protein YedE/YeeE
MAASFEASSTSFTPLAALAGGLLIGLSACLLLLALGRVAGISGIAGRLWGAAAGDRAWRLLFVLGLLAGAWGAHALSLGPPALPAPGRLSPGWLAAAGLLVGWGTARGSGCTSGHGVCGLGLRSKRSLAATAVFVAAGMLAVYVLRHVVGVL